jgi:hypothetical protein
MLPLTSREDVVFITRAVFCYAQVLGAPFAWIIFRETTVHAASEVWVHDFLS